MPSLKTNFIRTQITSQCYRYEFQLLSNLNVDPKYFTELQGYFLSMNQLIVFSYPFVYSIQEMKQLKSFNFMLSNGQKVHVNVIVQNTITLNSKQVAEDIHRQIMKGTNFLYSEGLNICLNPFEERKINFTTSLMPGFSISTQVVNNVIGFYLIPLETKITQFHSLSSLHEHSIILDYDSGNFYQKSAIVRYDKQNEIVHFRTGQKLSKNSLKALQIMPLSGYDLAMRLSSYYKRIRQVDRLKKFIEKWEIKFESRFMELPYNFFPVSHILLGNKQEKSLGQTLGSISAFNFQYNFRKLFINSTFDDQLRTNIIFLMPNIVVGQSSGNEQPIEVQGQEMTFYSQLVVEQEEFLLPIISEIENLKQRMSLNDCKVNVVKYNFYCGWANGMKRTLKELNQIVSTEKSNTNCDKIFVLTDLQDALRQQKQLQLGNNFILPQDYSQSLYRQIIQSLIQSNTYTHVVKAKQNEFRKYPDIIALKTTATIMTKLRLNPWKIKDIPFGTKPLVAISLSTKLQTSGSILVCGVGSLNAFLSKYTAHYARCTLETYAQTILRVMDEIMTKFKSIHKGFPKRAMIFRTGDFTSDCDGQFSSVQSKFTQLYQCKATYIILSSEFPLRVYNQIDLNYISKDTVKPTQLLCQVRYNNQRFIQLEADSPFYRVNILGIDQQEVSFEEKVIELTTKLCFSQQLMTEMRFGKGLGFVGYAEKFSQWIREYNNVSPMDQTLKDGVIVFL